MHQLHTRLFGVLAALVVATVTAGVAFAQQDASDAQSGAAAANAEDAESAHDASGSQDGDLPDEQQAASGDQQQAESVGGDAQAAPHDDAAHGSGEQHELGHGNAGEDLENVAEVKGDLAIYTFVVFLLLLAILSKFAWPPIISALEAREQHIADHISAAEAKHEEAKRLLAGHEAKLASAADEVRELLEEARRDAEHTKAQIIAEAKSAAEDESKRAVREVEQAKDAALHELANKSADTAIALAGQIVREQVSPERHAELVRESLSRLSAGSPSQN